MNITLNTALAIAAGIVGYTVFFVIVTALIGVALGVRLERVQFGAFLSARLFKIGQTEVRVSPPPFLFAGHVKWVRPADDTKPYAPWPVRALLCIAGPVLAIAACAVLLGGRAWDEAIITWPQMWAVVSDSQTPVNVNLALQPAFDLGGMGAAAAVVGVKAAMFNLLPLPIFNGGMFIATLLEAVTRRDILGRQPQWVLLSSILLPLSFVVFLIFRIVIET